MTTTGRHWKKSNYSNMTTTQDINQIAAELAGGMSLQDLRKAQADYTSRQPAAAEKTPEQIAAEIQYWDRVFAPRPEKPSLAIVRRTAQEMGYEEARRKFWAVLQLRAAHTAVIENRPEFEWRFDDGEKLILANLVRYFINDPASAYPLTKGLFLFGQNGTGKTEMMRAFSRFTAEYDLSKKFEFSSLSEIYTHARSDKEYDPVTPNLQFDRCFDEFGRFIGPIVRFGEPLDITEAIMEGRYNRFRTYGQLTHAISNMATNEAQAAFSPVIFDRMRQMFSSVQFKGTSKR